MALRVGGLRAGRSEGLTPSEPTVGYVGKGGDFVLVVVARKFDAASSKRCGSSEQVKH